ncbi:polyprenyl synthetase family protein [Piscirickettsia salmonis]|uniref:polyprenyl synthetase family protein n=1 Tax=Piscirickettsia salmonis TaxID=1238 RepID=UPI000F08B42A|nr:polyprenyl synthetase [Piscirickettsiaceae bacterium NZ-RLO2]
MSSKLHSWRQQFNTQLSQCIKQYPIQDDLLNKAMHYSLEGGKRIRPLLVYGTGHALDIPIEQLHPCAIAVEMIHVYSLIHDDLPAMDNDDLRRGRPTCHKAFDEATAILTGNALQMLAIEQLCQDHSNNTITSGISSDQRIQRIQTLCQASGGLGIAAGQSLDLQAENNSQLSLLELERLHRLKTAALIQASVRIAALSAKHITPQQLENLDQYAAKIGLAFQVQDDILDLESSTILLGKPAKSDLKNNKSTYPRLLGLKQAKAKLEELYQEALEALSLISHGNNTDALIEIADLIIKRNH